MQRSRLLTLDCIMHATQRQPDVHVNFELPERSVKAEAFWVVLLSVRGNILLQEHVAMD